MSAGLLAGMLKARQLTLLAAVAATALLGNSAQGAQVNVTTAHNDIGRTGQNLRETLLTPANVNSTQFGKLFSWPLNGVIYAQPLYVSNLAIPGKGTHNVVFVGTTVDSLYAFDADNNGGTNASPLWNDYFVSSGLSNQSGIMGTPVIDLPTKTMYLVTKETKAGAGVLRLHGIDITTGAEKFGGPVTIQGSIPGTGSGSTNGTLTFDATYQFQRSGLLLLNGVVYIPFGSVNDNGPWHGWIFSYSASTLKQIDAFNTTANGAGGGIWMSGAGLAAQVNDPSQPYGRMFVATGNGGFTATLPYTNSMSYSMSVLNLDLTGGVMTVKDEFTPYNWSALNAQDGDVGSGGVVLLPQQQLASGKTLNPLAQVGKEGVLYILDRNNLGGFNSAGDNVVQSVLTNGPSHTGWGAGIWGTPAYWNQNIYFGGTSPGSANSLTAYSFVNGVLSTAPTSQTAEKFSYPGPSPSISANATQDAIAWVINGSGTSNGNDVLFAYDASDLSNTLYSTNADLSRDNPGAAVEFTVPTVANGKVYVGAVGQFSVYGLLGSTPTVAAPVFTPASGSFTGSQKVTIADSTSGASIYYTTNGSKPTVKSTLYTGAITVTASTTVNAIASATGYLQGAAVSATYASTANAATPVLSLAGGTYLGPQQLTITDTSKDAVIYYTVDGSTPTTSSSVYSAPITIPVPEQVQALATAPGLLASSVSTATYDLDPVYAINFSQGFSAAEETGQMKFNGSTDLDDFRLQLTNGGFSEAGSAFDTTPVNIQSFTTDFVFQLSNPLADGITFTIQNNSASAVGGDSAGLGFSGIGKSVAIKFDLYSDAGEGANSTGLYINGAMPTTPFVTLANTPINLHSGDYTDAHVTYDGTELTLTLTDTVTLEKWSYSWAVNIPSIVGGETAYVGFTGSSNSTLSASQKLTSWTWIAGPPKVPNYPVGFDAAQMILNNGAALNGTSLEITNGSVNEHNSAYYSTPVDVESFSSDFDFQITKAAADGFTFVLQNVGKHAGGGPGGGLGYSNITNSVAIKFDLYSNAGEGANSTGVYVNGASPTVPSDDLTSSGIVLSSGGVIHVHISYDGTTLTWTLSTPVGPQYGYFDMADEDQHPAHHRKQYGVCGIYRVYGRHDGGPEYFGLDICQPVAAKASGTPKQDNFPSPFNRPAHLAGGRGGCGDKDSSTCSYPDGTKVTSR